MAEPTIPQRIARIEEECATPLGFAQRGVASWDQHWLQERRGALTLTNGEWAKLMEIETQVFGWAVFP